MPFISSVSGTGSKLFFNKPSVVLTAPSAVQSLTLTASDRTITPTWSAPASDGGSAITSYTLETQLNTDAWVNQGSWTSGTSLTVRNNSTNQARSYKVRVTANNAIGAGPSTESTSATPNFPAIGTPTIAGAAGYPSTAYNSTSSAYGGFRPLTVTFSPSVCAAYSKTVIAILNTPVGGTSYTTFLNSAGEVTFGSTAGQTYQINSIYNDSSATYVAPSRDQTYNCVIQTYNTDGDYIQSAFSANFTTAAQASYVVSNTTYDWGAESAYSDTTGVFTVTGNTFTQTSVYSLPGVNTASGSGSVGQITYRISNITIFARTGSAGTTICTSSRYFFGDFSGTSTSAGTAGGSKNALASPWSTNSGTTYQSQAQGWTLAYGNAGAGRLRVRGAGSIGTWSTSPDQRIYVYFGITGFQKTWTATTTNTTYYY